MNSPDVIIAGAGIIGLSIAWQLARSSPLQVLVLERGGGLGEGSTGASSAVCRVRYSRDEMVCLARDGIAAYRQWQDFTGLAQTRARFHQDGVLWLPGDDAQWAQREHRRMQGLGIATEVFAAAELRARFPALSACSRTPDLVSGAGHACDSETRCFFEPGGGYIDPMACAEDLLQACRQRGVDVRFNAQVQRILTRSGKVTGVSLADGETFFAGLVVNAAGPWCNALSASAGLQLPWQLVPTRIQVLYLDRPDELAGAIPVTVDMAAGIYFRGQNEGQQIVLGSTLESDERERVADPDNFNRSADEDFTQAKLHALHHRLPGLPYRGRVRSYCGLYTVNKQDVHPVLGATEVSGLLLANGFSGHGFKLAPAIGALMAQMISGDRPTDFASDVDPRFFAVDRDPIALPSKSVLA